MKRFLLLIGLLAISVFALAACSGGGTSSYYTVEVPTDNDGYSVGISLQTESKKNPIKHDEANKIKVPTDNSKVVIRVQINYAYEAGEKFAVQYNGRILQMQEIAHDGHEQIFTCDMTISQDGFISVSGVSKESNTVSLASSMDDKLREFYNVYINDNEKVTNSFKVYHGEYTVITVRPTRDGWSAPDELIIRDKSAESGYSYTVVYPVSDELLNPDTDNMNGRKYIIHHQYTQKQSELSLMDTGSDDTRMHTIHHVNSQLYHTRVVGDLDRSINSVAHFGKVSLEIVVTDTHNEGVVGTDEVKHKQRMIINGKEYANVNGVFTVPYVLEDLYITIAGMEIYGLNDLKLATVSDFPDYLASGNLFFNDVDGSLLNKFHDGYGMTLIKEGAYIDLPKSSNITLSSANYAITFEKSNGVSRNFGYGEEATDRFTITAINDTESLHINIALNPVITIDYDNIKSKFDIFYKDAIDGEYQKADSKDTIVANGNRPLIIKLLPKPNANIVGINDVPCITGQSGNQSVQFATNENGSKVYTNTVFPLTDRFSANNQYKIDDDGSLTYVIFNVEKDMTLTIAYN